MNTRSYIHALESDPAGEACEVSFIHADRVEQARAQMVDEPAAAGLAETFQALSDPSRIRLISALMDCELCVCDLSALVGMSQSAVSHQLRLLRNLRLVKKRKEGRIVYYSLDDEHISDLFQRGLDHYKHRNR